MDVKIIKYTDNAAYLARPDGYMTIGIDASKVIESWRDSVFSFEWLNADGKIKSIDQLSDAEKEKRAAVESAISAQKAIARPVLGIGLKDNIEIGSGRAELLTLAALGVKTISVHIPKSNEDEFKDFMADA